MHLLPSPTSGEQQIELQVSKGGCWCGDITERGVGVKAEKEVYRRHLCTFVLCLAPLKVSHSVNLRTSGGGSVGFKQAVKLCRS